MRYDFFIAHPGVHAASAAALERALHAHGRTAFRDKSQRGAGGWPRRIREAQVASWLTVVLLGKHEEGNHPWFEAECAAAIELAKEQHGLFVVRLPDFGKQAVPYGLTIADQMLWAEPGGAEEVAQSLDAVLRQHVRVKRHPPVCLIKLIDIIGGWLEADLSRVRDINRALSRLDLSISMIAPEGAPLVWRAAHTLYRLADQSVYEPHALSAHSLIRFLHELHIVQEPFAVAIHDWLDELASHYGGSYEDTIPAGPTLQQLLLVDAGEVPGLRREHPVPTPPRYDFFIAHAAADKPAARLLDDQLKAKGVDPGERHPSIRVFADALAEALGGVDGRAVAIAESPAGSAGSLAGGGVGKPKPPAPAESPTGTASFQPAIGVGKPPEAAPMRIQPGDVVALATDFRPVLRYAPPGTFTMGSPPDEPGRFDNEVQHLVTLTRPLWVMETPVTRAQWKALLGSDPSYFKRNPHLPVERINWFEAVAFANALSEKEGLPPAYEVAGPTGTLGGGLKPRRDYGAGDFRFAQVKLRPHSTSYRLPTEAEWEYLARAGTLGAIYAGSFQILGENNAPALDPIAWYGGNSGTRNAEGVGSSSKEMQKPAARSATQPVGQKAANLWGLRDMLGSVCEWCEDWFGAYEQTANHDPMGPPTGIRHVVRGGSWLTDARWVRAATRIVADPLQRFHGYGFRLVRTPSS